MCASQKHLLTDFFVQVPFHGMLGVADKWVPNQYKNYHVYHDGCRFWDARLGSLGCGDGKFLWMSILSNKNVNSILWLRWGPICSVHMSDPFRDRGATNVTESYPKVPGMVFQVYTLNQAKYWFECIFQLETLNSWMSIERFVPQPNYLSPLQFDEYTRSWILGPTAAQPESWQHPPCCCGKGRPACICGGRSDPSTCEDDEDGTDVKDDDDSAPALADLLPWNDSRPLSFRDARFDLAMMPGSDGNSRLDRALRRADAAPTLEAHLVAATSRRTAGFAVKYEIASFNGGGQRYRVLMSAAPRGNRAGGGDGGLRFACSCKDHEDDSRCPCKHALYVAFIALHRRPDGGAGGLVDAMHTQQRACLDAAAAAAEREVMEPIFKELRGVLEGGGDAGHGARQRAASLIRRAADTNPAARRAANEAGALQAARAAARVAQKGGLTRFV